jgi:hypothetical protein
VLPDEHESEDRDEQAKGDEGNGRHDATSWNTRRSYRTEVTPQFPLNSLSGQGFTRAPALGEELAFHLEMETREIW